MRTDIVSILLERKEMELYCCECKKNVKARLTTGLEIYPKLKSLHNDTFWICDFCKNYVGVFFIRANLNKALAYQQQSLEKRDGIFINCLIRFGNQEL